MSLNNKDAAKNVGIPAGFGKSGAVPVNIHHHNQQQQAPTQNVSQAQPQTQAGSQIPGHFQLSEPRIQTLTQAQYAQAQAQAAHARFQAHVQAQARAQAQAQAQTHSQAPAYGQAVHHLQSSGTNNAGVSSPPVSTPGTSSAKRTAYRPPSRPSGSSGAANQSQLKTMELAPAPPRKRKLTEKQIPDKVAAIVPESALYTQLLGFEARVDAALARKKVDIQESLKNPPRTQKILRIYVYNTFANLTQTTPGQDNVESPSWSLKIVGRILEDGVGSNVAGAIRKPNPSCPKFSSFFRKITIYLDQNLYPDNHVILWESSRSPALHEGFEVKRKGDMEFNAIIRLEMNYVPEKYKLSPTLKEVLGIEVETRPRILAAIWHYVKARNLQIPGDPSFFTCDASLRKVFGDEKVKFSAVPLKISPHLLPPQPIHIEHRIKLSGSSPVGNTCYDVLVDVPFSLNKEMTNFLENLENQKEIDACDEAICAAIKKLHEHKRRRAFFLGFSHSPAEFINSLIASQSTDLKLMAGDPNLNGEKERHAEFYNQPWVEDAVIRYLNRKPASGGDDAH